MSLQKHDNALQRIAKDSGRRKKIMKAFNVGLIILALAVSGRAADTLTEKLQRGLFEEEANHNLAAAMKEYQSIVAQSAEQRKVIATALFRLAECYRKLGQTNQATAAYQQLLRDYSDQEQLVQMAGKQSGAVAGKSGSTEYSRELERRIASLRVDLAIAEAEWHRLDNMSLENLAATDLAKTNAGLIGLERGLAEAEQRRAALVGGGNGVTHPNVQAADALIKVISEQWNKSLRSIPLIAKGQMVSLQAQLKALQTELQSAMALPMNQTVTPSRLNAEGERLLREEIRLAEQMVRDLEKRIAAGTATSSELANARKEVVRLKRQLPENLSPAQQRSLLEDQIQIVKIYLSSVENMAPDRLAPGELLSAHRELRSLQRDLAAIEDAGNALGTEIPAGASLTQAEAEELTRVRNLAQNSPDLLNAPSRDGYSVLQLAAREGYTAVVEFVLSKNADPNIRVRNITPLEFAAQRGHLRIVQMLLDKGARPNDGNALLHAAANGYKSIVELLAARGADVNRATGENETPLHAASWNERAGVVEVLLKNGARPDVLTNPNPQPHNTQWGELARAGATPLHFAVDRGNQKICELLLDAKGSASVTNYVGTTPLHLAAVRGNTNLMALLLERGADPNVMTVDNDWSPLMAAIGALSTNAVKLLLEKRADPNLAGLRNHSEKPHSPLHIASSFSPAPGIVKLLLEAKANMEVTNGAGFTPLQSAVRYQKDEVALVLLNAGANPNRTFQDGTTLLHLGADGRVALVRSLLEHDANPNVVDQSGGTPLSRAYSYAAEVARKNAMKVSTFAPPPPIPVNAVDSGEGGFVIDYQWQQDGTTRPVRLEGAYHEIVELLLKHGADPFMQRRGFIRAIRLDRAIPLFVRGTNALNQHTLMEALAAVYEISQDDLPFPDWSKIEIHRLDAKNEKVIRVDAASMLVNSNCAADFPLEWGDQIEIPMADHRVTAKWELMDPLRSTLIGCNTRTVQLVAGGTNASITLGMAMGVPRGKRGNQFRLGVLLRRDDRFRRLLRTSSDLSRVMVKRKDSKTGELGRHVIDALRVSLPEGNDSSPNLVPWTQDFWLRDGDVIEVPEKQ
jgi:ankyrin repeat protein